MTPAQERALQERHLIVLRFGADDGPRVARGRWRTWLRREEVLHGIE